ncbi:MAG: hypothetical protein V2A64_05845 [Candidatus Omnitrophota bacterium]
MSKETQNKYLFNQIWNMSKKPKCLVFVSINKTKIQGFAVLRYLHWDSKHLDKNMWQIAYLTAQGCYSETVRIKNGLLRGILKYTGGMKNMHLSCKVDTSDISTIHVLESSGFKLMDTIVTWLFKPDRSIPKFKNMFKVRGFQKKDLDSLMELAKHSFSTNRFHLDPHIPNDNADRLYAEWVKNYCAGINKGKTRVIIAEGKNRIAGFLAYRLNEEMKRMSGYKIIGQGLMAVSPYAKGAAVSLVNATTKDVLLDYDFAEFDGLITNHEAIRIYEAFNFEIIRSKYTFHYFRK